MSVCGGCDLTYHQLQRLLEDDDKIKDFILAHSLIKSKISCGVCGTEVALKKGYIFRCNRQRRVPGKQKRFQRCNFYQSALKGSWFSRSHVAVKDLLTLSFLWTQTGCTLRKCEQLVSCSLKTIIERLSLCREVAFHYCVKESVKVGGVEKVVEVYEARFGKGKYSCGSLDSDLLWAIGGIERSSRHFFLTTVDEWNERTLIKIFRENILPGTHIITNYWDFKGNLKQYGYQVSKFEEYKRLHARASPTHKRSQEVQVQIPIFPESQIHFSGYLVEALFKWRLPNEEERFHTFLLHVAKLYS